MVEGTALTYREIEFRIVHVELDNETRTTVYYSFGESWSELFERTDIESVEEAEKEVKRTVDKKLQRALESTDNSSGILNLQDTTNISTPDLLNEDDSDDIRQPDILWGNNSSTSDSSQGRRIPTRSSWSKVFKAESKGLFLQAI